jgi:hypothetical protein
MNSVAMGLRAADLDVPGLDGDLDMPGLPSSVRSLRRPKLDRQPDAAPLPCVLEAPDRDGSRRTADLARCDCVS